MILNELFEGPQLCPECGGISFSDLVLAEKKDACYYKVKASAKVWPSAYASGRLVQCRKKGADNYGNKNESEDDNFGKPATLMKASPEALKTAQSIVQKQADKNVIGQAKIAGAVPDQGVAEGLPQTLRKVVPGYAKREIDRKMDAEKFGKTDVDRDANYYRYKKIQDKLKEQGVAEQSSTLSTANDINTSGAKSLTKKALGKVGRTVMPTLGFTDAAERLSNKDYTGAGISAAAGGIGLIPAWPAQVASGGLELVNMTRDEANALGGYDKLAKEISKNFTPATDPSYLPENPAQSEGVGTLINRGKDFVKYLRRDAPLPDAPDPNLARDIATRRNVGGKAIPSLGQPGKVVTSPTADKALVKLGGKNVDTTPGPTVTPGSSNDLNLDPVFDVPAYVRKGLPDPVTTPVGKPKIKVQPGETVLQAIQRTKTEQEFSNFLKGQGGQSFGTSTAAPTSGANQVPTVKLPGGQTIPDPARLSPSGQYNTQSGSSTRRDSIDKIERDDKTAVDAMVNRAKQSVADREARAKKQSDRIEPVQPNWDSVRPGLDEQSRKKREKPEVDYDDEYDAMVARVRKLAGIGPMKTVWDPARRVYKNVPTADQPKR